MYKLSELVSRSARVVHPQAAPRWGGHVIVVDPKYSEVDPFIFLVHHVHSFKAGEVSGFPPHAHRGFETVTYAIEGAFDHGDSRGNKGRYGNGDVQWLTTGKGVLHSEMFVTDKTKSSTFNGLQLWLNLSAKLKMCEPGYKMMWNKDIPVITLTPAQDDQLVNKNSVSKNGNVWVKIIAGKVNEFSNIVEKETMVSFLHVKIDPLSTWQHYAPKEHNCFAYVLSGEGYCDNSSSKTPNLKKAEYAIFDNDGDRVEVTNTHSSTPLDLIYLEGKPLKEPFAHQGPFVMNTQKELSQAFIDLRNGEFGEMEEY